MAVEVAADLFIGSHAAKLGFGYEDNRGSYFLQNESILQFAPNAFLRTVDSIVGEGVHHNRIPTAFVQNTWQLDPRLSVSAGLRWSRQKLSGDSSSQTFPNEWQPRAGLVYQLGELGTQRVFGSYGRFHQQIPLYHATVWYTAHDFGEEGFTVDPRTPGATPIFGDVGTDPGIRPDASGLKVEHFDEFALGYERLIAGENVLRVRGIHRVLRAGFGVGSMNPGLVFGNYGEGDLSFLPVPTREYTAFEITLSRAEGHRLQGLVSYVLSRTHGNYSGLFASDQGRALPNNNPSIIFAEQAANSTGLLPNDRTHVLKLHASYRFDFGLTVGTFGSVMSGTPLNELNLDESCQRCTIFAVPRGTVGRTPTLWDLNFRFTYDVPLATSRTNSRVLVDVLHVGSPREAAALEQFRLLGRNLLTGEIVVNPNFMEVNRYQPPMAVRLGVEVGF